MEIKIFPFLTRAGRRVTFLPVFPTIPIFILCQLLFGYFSNILVISCQTGSTKELETLEQFCRSEDCPFVASPFCPLLVPCLPTTKLFYQMICISFCAEFPLKTSATLQISIFQKSFFRQAQEKK